MKIMGTEIIPLKTVAKLCWRSWRLYRVRQYWRSDQWLRRTAKEREWAMALSYFNFERNYRFVKLMASVVSDREKA